MVKIADLGRRVELVSMDPHCQGITLALYRQGVEGPAYLVHSYSGLPEAAGRLGFVAGAMALLGGMELAGPRLLRFPCGAGHELAARRTFLEACKLDPALPPAPRPLSFLDKKSGCQLQLVSLGEGRYQVALEGGEASRATAVAGGLVKLGQMQNPAPDQVAFACGQAHDTLVGLLLVRAVNVRATLREQELAASRGMLAAPSAQQQ
jgi:hypothetical protein